MRPDRATLQRPHLRVEAAGITDQGLRYLRNQDSLIVRPDLGLYLVADGASLPAGGGLASCLAARAVERCFSRARRRAARSGTTTRDERRRLARGFAQADASVREAATRHPQHAGMCTTMAALVVAQDGVALAHVGDSRIFRVRGGEIERLTRDHSVEEDTEWRAGHPGDPALSDPKKARFLTQAIGHGGPLRLAARSEAVEPGDTFLLCTDGLYTTVHEEELAAVLSCDPRRLRRAMTKRGHAPELALVDMQCAWSIERGNERGGHDNLTVIVVRFTAEPPPGSPVSPPSPRPRRGSASRRRGGG